MAKSIGPHFVKNPVSYVTWCISNWHNSYSSIFFSKIEWWLAELLFLSLKTEAWTFCKMNALNSLIFTSHQKNWEKCLLFNLANYCLLTDQNSQNDNYFHSKWSLNVVLSVNRYHFVNLLSFASSYFFLSLR